MITNTMPPGGEGAASVALGVALPGGPGSMEVNPALLAWEGDRTLSVVQYSASESELLPKLRSSEPMVERVRSLGLRYPVKPGTDVALGYSWHEVDFGRTPGFDWNGDLDGSWIHGTEAVHHVVLAGRLGGIASVGLGWRWIDSRFAEGLKDSLGKPIGTGTASTWDLGLRLAPTWRVPATPIRITPSLGMSWITLGEDSISYGLRAWDPIERVRRWGAAITATVPDLVTGEVFLDEETNLSWADRRESFGYEGWSFEALGIVRWSTADLIDPQGQRFETQKSTQYIVDAKRVWRLYKRASTGKLLSPDAVEMDGFPLPTWSVAGVDVTPNVRFTWTESEITSEAKGGIRKGQRRLGWAISI